MVAPQWLLKKSVHWDMSAPAKLRSRFLAPAERMPTPPRLTSVQPALLGLIVLMVPLTPYPAPEDNIAQKELVWKITCAVQVCGLYLFMLQLRACYWRTRTRFFVHIFMRLQTFTA